MIRHSPAPGPPPRFLGGNLPAFRRDPLGFLLGAVREWGDVVGLWIGRQRAHLLCNPEHVQHVLQTKQHDYLKDVPTLGRLRLVLGQGLVTSSGALWRRQRRIMQPAFSPECVAALAPVMQRVIADVAARWHALARAHAVIDVHREMMHLAFRVVAETLFSADLSGITDDVRASVAVIQRQTDERLYGLFGSPLWVPTRRNRVFRAALARLDGIVRDLIARRRDARAAGEDLLDMLITARDETTGAPMADRQVRDEVLTLLLAGHENTGNALTWMWYLIARHPDVGRRIHTELDAVLGDRPPTWLDLPALRYTRMVTEEALRLYPTSWMLLRCAAWDDEISGFHIPAGSVVLISPYVTHRHPAYWPNPDRFDPERFAESRTAERHRFAYLPFGAGARKCIGSHFAAGEVQLVVAALSQHYCLELLGDAPIEPEPLVSLPPKHGLPMRLSLRRGSG